MCGIVGLIHKQKNGFTQKEIDMFTQLLFADQIRGSDGTGIFYNRKKNKGSIAVLKAAMPASFFINTKAYDDATKTFFSDSNFAIGHNRAATKGKVNNECTHPFREQHIVLIHNGTLNTQKELHPTIEVDSHAICHSMATKGVKETIKEINGAFALVWFDSKEKTLNLCRNSQRPLSIIETSSCFIICSEIDLGLWILNRNNITVTKEYEVEPKKIYSFNIEDMTKHSIEDVEFKTWPSYNDNFKHWPHNTYNDDAWNEWQGQQSLYSIGEKIKFRTGPIRKHTNSNRFFIEGQIMKYPLMKPNYILVENDFEKEARVRVFGTEEELLKIAAEERVIGQVTQVIIKEPVGSGPSIYLVTKAEKYYKTETNIIPFEKKETIIPELGVCDFCKAPREHNNTLYENLLCDSCFTELAASCGSC